MIERLGGTVTFDENSSSYLVVGVDLKSVYRLVTDAGLEHLKGLTNLQSLNLISTGVTTACMEDLQSALPNCKITK